MLSHSGQKEVEILAKATDLLEINKLKFKMIFNLSAKSMRLFSLANIKLKCLHIQKPMAICIFFFCVGMVLSLLS